MGFVFHGLMIVSTKGLLVHTGGSFILHGYYTLINNESQEEKITVFITLCHKGITE